MSTGNSAQNREAPLHRKVIGFSISWQKEDLLAHGLGLEHLRELLVRLARPILGDADIAYAGYWEEQEDNFTFDLLRLVLAEQQDEASEDTNPTPGPEKTKPDKARPSRKIGILYNHSAWPQYLKITPRIEAQWINCCRIVRITQEMAGFPPGEIATGKDVADRTPRGRFNAAVTLCAMRRLMMREITIDIPGIEKPDIIPGIDARILIGGKVDKYSGFIPGLFEEALTSLEVEMPLYVLGGFGGATETLAQAILGRFTRGPGPVSSWAKPAELTLSWQKGKNKMLETLLSETEACKPPSDFVPAQVALDKLAEFLEKAHSAPADTLHTGLTDDETRTLLESSDISTVVKLVKQGLRNSRLLPEADL